VKRDEDVGGDWTIRAAVAEDYGGLCSLYDELDELHRLNLPRTFRRAKGPSREKEYLLSLMRDGNVGLFVACSAGALVGMVCVVEREAPALPIFVPRRYAVIDSLVVTSESRRTGLGRALIERAQEWAQARGLCEVELGVWEFNHAALGFYESLGYRTVYRRMSRRLDAEQRHP